jgi:hypothetical protein
MIRNVGADNGFLTRIQRIEIIAMIHNVGAQRAYQPVLPGIAALRPGSPGTSPGAIHGKSPAKPGFNFLSPVTSDATHPRFPLASS